VAESNFDSPWMFLVGERIRDFTSVVWPRTCVTPHDTAVSGEHFVADSERGVADSVSSNRYEVLWSMNDRRGLARTASRVRREMPCKDAGYYRPRGFPMPLVELNQRGQGGATVSRTTFRSSVSQVVFRESVLEVEQEQGIGIPSLALSQDHSTYVRYRDRRPVFQVPDFEVTGCTPDTVPWDTASGVLAVQSRRVNISAAKTKLSLNQGIRSGTVVVSSAGGFPGLVMEELRSLQIGSSLCRNADTSHVIVVVSAEGSGVEGDTGVLIERCGRVFRLFLRDLHRWDRRRYSFVVTNRDRPMLLFEEGKFAGLFEVRPVPGASLDCGPRGILSQADFPMRGSRSVQLFLEAVRVSINHHSTIGAGDTLAGMMCKAIAIHGMDIRDAIGWSARQTEDHIGYARRRLASEFERLLPEGDDVARLGSGEVRE
jgi:hypothetical protein